MEFEVKEEIPSYWGLNKLNLVIDVHRYNSSDGIQTHCLPLLTYLRVITLFLGWVHVHEFKRINQRKITNNLEMAACQINKSTSYRSVQAKAS